MKTSQLFSIKWFFLKRFECANGRRSSAATQRCWRKLSGAADGSSDVAENTVKLCHVGMKMEHGHITNMRVRSEKLGVSHVNVFDYFTLHFIRHFRPCVWRFPPQNSKYASQTWKVFNQWAKWNQVATDNFRKQQSRKMKNTQKQSDLLGKINLIYSEFRGS